MLKSDCVRIVVGVAAIVSRYSLKYVRLVQWYLLDHYPHPFQRIYVDPAKIQTYGGRFTNNPYRYGGRFSLAYYAGATVRGGRWDRDTECVTGSAKYNAVFDRYEHGCRWEETGIYDEISERAARTGSYDGCTTRDDIERRYERIDALYERIKAEGYEDDGSLDQVCVNIGRDGEIMFNGNGNHRLFIAKVLGIREIPVRVLVRHERWMHKRKQFVDERAADAESEVHAVRADHPDLQDLAPRERTD
ncbi:hypothetical protein D8Y22_07940 [Salinadaptatus halalkaliphilus]|uniref:ParB/Sulfiredoxin domain-containing protein n=2 Tax=Salinadaptatus halalkaliphilus TaxID=2419781 RepID=A0A4S3TLS7_9EURY|nr:hypothetical protein D8Y22_07940 [Salinadaptatus halalkaliphilus]